MQFENPRATVIGDCVRSAIVRTPNSIDVLVGGPKHVLLTPLDPVDNRHRATNRSFKLPVWVYVNADNGVFSLAFPTELPTGIRDWIHRDFVFNWIDELGENQTGNLFDGITSKPGPYQNHLPDPYTIQEWSNKSLTDCYLFRYPHRYGQKIMLHIPRGVERIGTLTLGNGWRTFRWLNDDVPQEVLPPVPAPSGHPSPPPPTPAALAALPPAPPAER